MAKTRINLTSDVSLIEEAKKKNFNVSAILEDALAKHLKKEVVEIEEGTHCEFCGGEGVRETRDTINKSDRGLTWLYPDERWICNSCLRSMSSRITK
jgi:uncharacterized protein with PIN domain